MICQAGVCAGVGSLETFDLNDSDGLMTVY